MRATHLINIMVSTEGSRCGLATIAPRRDGSVPALAGYRAWKLQDAKARFNDLVRRAREEGPQRVTVYGRDVVVVVSAAAFARTIEPADRLSLY